VTFIVAALRSRCGHYIFAQWFLISSSSSFSSPNLSRPRLDVYLTSTHGVALVHIKNAGLKHAARGSLKYRTQKIAKKSPSAHHPTTLSGYILATKAHFDNRKKPVKHQYLLQKFSQYDELPAH